MDVATAIKLGRKTMKVANKVIKYIREDNEATFGLDEEVRAELTGLKLIEIWEGERHLPICQYTTADGSLTIEPRMEGGLEFVRPTAHPFPASSRLWHGPDLIKNNQYRSMLASLFHDLIWEHADEIAKAWGVSKQAVLQWGDGILYALWMYASETSALGRVEARVAWQVCEYSRGWYHKVKKLIGLHCLAFALLLAGCGTPPDWTVSGVEGTNAIYRAMGKAQAVAVVQQGDEAPERVDEPMVASARPWRDCRYSSNWNGSNASKRMMNMVSPKFSDAKFQKYLEWQISVGCDHVHLLLVNEGDGEGAGYDALTDSSARKTALQRVAKIRARGLGVVAWIVADDSDGYRKKIFADPAKYANGLKDYMPYLSYIVLGLEMDEGEGSAAKWKALRDAIKKAGWDGPFATHHTSGKSTHAGLGTIVMDQLDPSCTTSDIKSSVKALRAKGYEVNGFEYSRGPDASKAKAAIEAGAFGVGNWKGSAATVTTPAVEAPAAATADEVDFASLDWCWGGFKGGSAKEVSGCQIGSLKVSGGNMSYKWVKGGCEKLGATSSTDADHTPCALFCKIDGKWKGGKWEWISTSRTTRGLKNIEEGYGGWDKTAIAKATEYAFCIVSSDGKKRSNVIKAGR